MAYAPSGCARRVGGDFMLTNVVEVDETYIGGKGANKDQSTKLKQGRGTVGKTAVVGMVERGGKVKAQPVERTNAVTLIPFVEANVEHGATGLHRRCRSLWRVAKHPQPVHP